MHAESLPNLSKLQLLYISIIVGLVFKNTTTIYCHTPR